MSAKKIEEKDKIIDDLLKVVKSYAGIPDHEIFNSRPRCEGYFWAKETGHFCYMDKFGHVTDGQGPKLALDVLREYNLCD